MLPLLAIMFTVLDLSIAIFVKNTVQFAVCQGVRYAVTSQTLPGMGQDASIKSVVQGYTLGLLDALSADHVGSEPHHHYLLRSVNPGPGHRSGSNVGGNIVVVSASGLSWAWMVPLLRSTAPLRVRRLFGRHHGGDPPCRRTRPLGKREAGAARPWSNSPSALTIAVPSCCWAWEPSAYGSAAHCRRPKLTRDIAHMYALGADFSLPGTQAIAAHAQPGLQFVEHGKAVLLFSRIAKIQQIDCDAAGLHTCPNLNLPVFTQRIVMGNPAQRTSSSEPRRRLTSAAAGTIASVDYCQRSRRSSRRLSMRCWRSAPGSRRRWWKGISAMPDINFLGFPNSGGGYYVRFLF